jgi:hypothetical protein
MEDDDTPIKRERGAHNDGDDGSKRVSVSLMTKPWLVPLW